MWPNYNISLTQIVSEMAGPISFPLRYLGGDEHWHLAWYRSINTTGWLRAPPLARSCQHWFWPGRYLGWFVDSYDSCKQVRYSSWVICYFLLQVIFLLLLLLLTLLYFFLLLLLRIARYCCCQVQFSCSLLGIIVASCQLLLRRSTVFLGSFQTKTQPEEQPNTLEKPSELQQLASCPQNKHRDVGKFEKHVST